MQLKATNIKLVDKRKLKGHMLSLGTKTSQLHGLADGAEFGEIDKGFIEQRKNDRQGERLTSRTKNY